MGPKRRTRLLPAVLATAAMAMPSARAMMFSAAQTADKKAILYVHDCGLVPEFDDNHVKKTDGKKGCDEWETMVEGPVKTPVGMYPGDAKVMDQILTDQEKKGKPYEEVWLFSGGGNLNEGIETAKVLRRHHVAVRVPKGAMCVSSCTVIFMGGYLRYVDGSYRVHSGSAVMEGTTGGDESLIGIMIAEVRKDPDGAFKEYAELQQVSQRSLARQLQRLFQNTLLIPFNTYLPDDKASFENWAKSNPPHLAYLDPDNPQRAADVQRYKAEGAACLQDIAMRIERDAMTQAITDMQAILPSLGKRAAPALDMVSAMYMTSIKETSALSHETMLKMGYITEDINAGN
jgi:hypothetical protein